MTLTVFTIGGNTYNGYCSLAEANEVLAVEPLYSATWAALTDDQKSINIVAATNKLDLQSWQGSKTVSTQDNDWPRTGITCNGVEVDDATIPTNLVKATSLLAVLIEMDPSITAGTTSGSGEVDTLKIGTFSISYDTETSDASTVRLGTQTIDSLLACYLSFATSKVGTPVSSGFDGESCFTDRQYPDLTRGLG